MQNAAKYSWDAIVVTCVSKSCCDAYVDELNRRKRTNLIDAKVQNYVTRFHILSSLMHVRPTFLRILMFRR